MAVTYNIDSLRDRLGADVRTARVRAAAGPGRSEWYRRGRRIADMAYVPRAYLICAALLARSADADVDPLALRTDPTSPRSYSPRRVAHEAIRPVALREGLNLLTTTGEPLNAQPFFRYDRVDRIARARHREDLDTYITWLADIAHLDRAGARGALIEFLRARLDDPTPAAPTPPPAPRMRADQLPDIAAAFVAEASEGGRRAQAIGAAIIASAHPGVRTHRITAGRGKPGDIYAAAPAGGHAIVAEVKDKPVGPEDILTWVRALAGRTERATYFAVAHNQPALDTPTLEARAAAEAGIVLVIHTSLAAAAREHLRTSPLAPAKWARRFAEGAERHLAEVGAPPATIERWRQFLGAGDPACAATDTTTPRA